jgi:uncharacterized protein
MVLTGQHIVRASAQQIWDMLMNPDILAKVTPFITSLEVIDSENYKSVAEVKMGPVGGTFTGTVSITDKTEPTNFKLSVVQNSKMGNGYKTTRSPFFASQF